MLDAASLKGKKPGLGKGRAPLSRSPRLYHQAYRKYQAVIPPLLKTAQEADGSAGDFNSLLIEELNQ
ncbi:MAG: hypothetical protein ACE5LX_03950, partial [Nitrospinota bacterium]